MHIKRPDKWVFARTKKNIVVTAEAEQSVRFIYATERL